VCGGEQVGRALAVATQEPGLIPSRDYTGNVKDDVLAFDGTSQGAKVLEVAWDLPDAEFSEAGGLRGGANQGGDFDSSMNQGFGEVCPDEPRRTGDQRLHTLRS
jgi:hypothetical protein